MKIKIYLVRHGESEGNKIYLVRYEEIAGNVNREVYNTTPDYAVKLTDKGKEQAKTVGKILRKDLIVSPDWRFYVSPYKRTVETYEILSEQISSESFLKTGFKWGNKTDVRLREIEINLGGVERTEAFEARYKSNPFYFKVGNGESGTQVFDRVASFVRDLKEDIKEIRERYTASNVNIVIVSHAFTIRVLLMAMLDMSPEDFNRMKKPENGEIIELSLEDYGFQLQTEPERIFK